ncbi:MAG: YdcF family protein [Bdellovibrionales bacterium]|nr:YdcF family protein [Bdellovibrionales bacterium]
MSRRFRGAVILVAGSLLVALYLWLRGAADAVYAYQDTVDGVHLPPVDAIVVLAGGRGRISTAGDLWYRYRIDQAGGGSREGVAAGSRPILYFSGLGAQSTWGSIRGQLRTGVMQVIQSQDVVLETQSTNTEENAQWLLQYARERGWKSILLVTSRYHMRRAKLIFQKLIEKDDELSRMLRPDGAEPPQSIRVETLSVIQDPFEPGEWAGDLHGVRVTLGEFFKWWYYAHFWEPKLQTLQWKDPKAETR